MPENNMDHALKNMVKNADLHDKKDGISGNANGEEPKHGISESVDGKEQRFGVPEVGSGRGQKLIIREMQPEDVPAVAALEAACFSEPWSEQAFLDALKQPEALMMAAIGMGNNPMGYCGIYLSADEGEITNVAVRPDHRKKGIADAILTDVLSESQKRGARTIYLEVRESNLPAQKLYEKHGFVSCGIRKNFYRKPTEHAIVMSCDLTRRISE